MVVAAGRATRFGGSRPKQFQRVAGRTVLEWSVRSLVGRPGVGGAIVVLAPDELGGPYGVLARGFPGVLDVVAGGEVRAESVRRGLAAVGQVPFVLVHDAARPVAPPGLVDAVIAATREHGAAVPALEVRDTVKSCDAEGWITATLDRRRVRLAQTPQGFRSEWLHGALERAREAGLAPTDEAAAVERDGRRIAVVAGDPDNVKITTPRDLAQVERRLGGEPTFQLRVGTGFDIHRRGGAERRLVLGGVVFEGEPGLVGHSDADVVLHAAMDALLGAAALGDIGVHFPPEDPRYAGAASTALARQVGSLVAGAGYEIVNLDLTLLAESPRIRDRAREMRETLASCLGLAPERIGLKASTLEGLGALGRGEGIACQAVALLSKAGPS